MSFEHWWAEYPKKVGKLDAMKAWRQVAAHFPPIEQMLSLLQQQKLTEMWLEDAGKYIPYPASYLRAGRFLDELEVDLGPNVNGKQWHETASGIEAKGLELNISPDQFDDWQAFRAAVLRAADTTLRAA